MTRLLSISVALGLLAGIGATPAFADWVSFSGAENARNIAEIHIADDHVRIELEIFVEDVLKFDRLIPDEILKGVERPPLEERIRRFSGEDLQVLADGDVRLFARLEKTEFRYRKKRPSPYAGKINPYTGRIIPGPPKDPRVFFVELVYPFETPPKSLTFVTPSDERGFPEASVGFITRHRQVQVTDFRFLPVTTTVDLDWDDPWYSAYREKGLKRWQRGPVMSFLYIEPLEVRHEVLARVRDLEAWFDLGLRGREYIEPDENEPLKKRVAEFLMGKEAVTIDGRHLEPILDRTAFVKYAVTGSTFLTEPERLPLDTAMVGVIFTYLTDQIPAEVRMQWDLWSDRVRMIPTDAVDPAGPFPGSVTPDDNVQVWTNFLKTYEPPTVVGLGIDESLTMVRIPLGSVLCLLALFPLCWSLLRRRKAPLARFVVAVILLAGGVLLLPHLKLTVPRPEIMSTRLTGEQATKVLDTLLRNTYRSFDFRKESDVYDKLAVSVTGDLLADIYLQNRQSLAVAQAGGAQARVKEVEIREAALEHLADPPLAMRYRATWTAHGSVGHWGHVHTRTNLSTALITVAPVAGTWKIIELELLSEERL